MSGEAPAPVHYYVYYRVRGDTGHEDAEASVRAMQASLERRTGVTGRLMERRGDEVTWMEVYESVGDPVVFEAALQIEAAAHRVNDLVEPGSARHMERFVECV